MGTLNFHKWIMLIFSLFIFKTISCRKESERGCFLKNIVPYNFLDTFTDGEKAELLKSMEDLQSKTCLLWVAWDDIRFNITSHVRFRRPPDDDCFTMYEKLSSRNYMSDVYLTTKCIFNRQKVNHELMHALGFRHEHQRGDRNCYIKVAASAIEKVPRFQFSGNRDNQYKIKVSEPWLERFPYDKFSITHHKRSDRLKNIEEPFDIPWPVGHESTELTYLDFWKINYKYCGAPHYCDLHKEHCQIMEYMEKTRDCSVQV